MKLVMTLLVRDGTADELDAQVSFHLNAGVDVILVADRDAVEHARTVLASYGAGGQVQLVPSVAGLSDQECRTALARLAASHYGASWVFDSVMHEYWWPRSESLKDVLVGVPPRYTVVQALVRRFLPAAGGGLWVERRSLDAYPADERMPGRWLRPAYRADSALVLVAPGAAPEEWRVPLRAWYPIELFDHATGRTADPERGVGDTGLVSDTRLVDALTRLRSTGTLALPVPDLVDDAAYAVECAMLGEADLSAIEGSVDDLERRIATLEARLWPRAQRIVRRLARRPG